MSYVPLNSSMDEWENTCCWANISFWNIGDIELYFDRFLVDF
jgi:hypothetical protein